MKITRFIFALATVFLLSVACSSDDNDGGDGHPPASGSYFTYDGTDYPIKTMIIERGDNDWSDDGSREYYISFLTSEVNLMEDGDYFPIQFPVSVFDFILYSDGQTRPATGDYVFNDNYDLSNICQEGTLITNVTIGDDNEMVFGEYAAVLEGDLEIIRSGSTFEVSFEVQLHNAKSLTGYYKGSAIEYDEID